MAPYSVYTAAMTPHSVYTAAMTPYSVYTAAMAPYNAYTDCYDAVQCIYWLLWRCTNYRDTDWYDCTVKGEKWKYVWYTLTKHPAMSTKDIDLYLYSHQTGKHVFISLHPLTRNKQTCTHLHTPTQRPTNTPIHTPTHTSTNIHTFTQSRTTHRCKHCINWAVLNGLINDAVNRGYLFRVSDVSCVRWNYTTLLKRFYSCQSQTIKSRSWVYYTMKPARQ